LMCRLVVIDTLCIVEPFWRVDCGRGAVVEVMLSALSVTECN